MTHPTPAQFTLKRRKGRTSQLYFGHQKPMDLSPPDRSFDPVRAWWNNTVAPWARGERA